MPLSPLPVRTFDHAPPPLPCTPHPSHPRALTHAPHLPPTPPPHTGLDGDTLLARVEREEGSLATFAATTQHEFNDMASLHRWIFHKHAAYAATRHLQVRPYIAPI